MNELEVAIEAAKEAGAILLQHFDDQLLQANEKSGDPRDIVTQADLESESKILSVLKLNFPTHSVLAEESGLEDKNSNALWVIDPLDGTANFFKKHRDFCVLIAYVLNGLPQIGVTYFPLTDELFVAERGKGSQKNAKSIHVSQEADISRMCGVTQMSHRPGFRERNMMMYQKLLLETRSIHVLSACTARALTDVAEGIADFEFRVGFNYWDFVAGALLVEEAGGVSTDLEGKPITKGSKSTLISNGMSHNELLRRVEAALAD